jgi:3-hexulose-6-phosphate synthase/6-phospho-3-hexuloisomerase
MQPTVQVSLDYQTIDEALAVAEVAVAAGVDWLEAGTPLILGEGLHAVRALVERYPDHPVVADLKTMDAGYLEAEMMYQAGAEFTVVMGVAHEESIRGAVAAGKTYGRRVMGDVMLHPDKPACAKRMEELGIDIVIVHTGFDERHCEVGRSPLDDLPGVLAAVTIPVQAVGGLSIEQAAGMPAMGVPMVVIGAPLAVDDHELKPGSGGDMAKLHDILAEVVRRVKA